MTGMDIDLPLPQQDDATCPRQPIVQRLTQLGIPTPSCLVNFTNSNKLLIPDLVRAILPSDEDIIEIRRKFKEESEEGTRYNKLSELFAESLFWIQWMMFGQDPHDCLEDMARKGSGQRAVCGAVWGHNDLAYRCRTCEHDPTCAICVPCFQNGDHEDHDCSIIYTGGGCCDCGDETAWKRKGFCSKHKFVDHIQPLSEELESCVGPVPDVLFARWQDKVVSAQHRRRAGRSSRNSEVEGVANEFSSATISMLLAQFHC